jgi:hypothetical protein
LPGQEAGIEAGAAPVTGPTAKGRLARMLAEGGHAKEALGLFPELTQDPETREFQRTLRQRFLGESPGGELPEPSAGPPALPGSGAPAPPGADVFGPGPGVFDVPATGNPPHGAIAKPAPRGGLVWSRRVNLAKDGSISVQFSGDPKKYESKTDKLQLPDGRVQLVDRTWDPSTATYVGPPIPFGEPVYAELLQRFSFALQSRYGLKPGTPVHDRALGQMVIIEKAPAEIQAFAFQQLNKELSAALEHTGGAGVLKEDFLERAHEAAEQRKREEKGRELLSTEEAGRLGVPFGTTRAEAAKLGKVPLGETAQGQHMAGQASLTLVDRMDTLADTLFTAKGPLDRIKQLPRTQWALAVQSDSNLVLFESLKEGVLSNIVRTFGERGTLTDQDIKRARAMLPNLTSGFLGLGPPDTRAVALGKLRQLRELITEIDARSTTPGSSEPPPPRRNGERTKLRGRLIRRPDGFLEWVEER